MAGAYPIALRLCDLYPTVLPNVLDRAAILSVVLGVAVPLLVNLVYSQERAEKRITKAYGDLVELLIVESIDRAKLIEVSLKGGKVYIGFALRNRITRWPESHMSMLPVSSGYRDKDTLELEITTNYAPAISNYFAGNAETAERPAVALHDFRVIIPKSEIISARLFDPDLHQQFQAADN